MFKIYCPTCNAGLNVRRDELIGQILPCPKCGGMVKIEPPENHESQQLKDESATYKRFPDPLVAETQSGIIGQMDNLDTGETVLPSFGDHAENPNEPSPLSDKERKIRKILLILLAGLLGILLLVFAFLMLRQPSQKNADKVPPKDKDVVRQIVQDIQNQPVGADNNIDENKKDSGAKENDTVNDTTNAVPVHQGTENENTNNAVVETNAPIVPEQSQQSDAAPTQRVIIKENDETQNAFQSTKLKRGKVLLTLPTDEQITARLNSTALENITFDKTTLYQFLRWVSAMLDVPITIEPDAIKRDVSIAKDIDKTTLDKITLADALAEILKERGLKSTVEDQQVTVSAIEPGKADNAAEQTAECKTLDEVLSLNYYEPVQLSKALETVEKRSGLIILVDHRSLNRNRTPLRTIFVSVQIDNKPLREVLTALLGSAETVPLSFQVVNEKTIVIGIAQKDF